MKTLHCAALIAVLLFGHASSRGADAFRPSNISLRNELSHSINRASEWLVKNQSEEGYWSTPEQPAVTALALVALQREKDRDAKTQQALDKGYAFILSQAQPDGSFHGGKGLVNYNTSLCLLALASTGDDRYRREILRAREYLVGSQIDLGEPGVLDTPFDGGIGYGSKYQHSDMGNTLQALEALYYSKSFAADAPEGEGRDLNWEAAIHFLQNCQNLPSHNKQEWASDDAANKGGFIYYPGHSMAGSTNLPNGRVALRSYGSISYGGLLSYIYADLKPDDPRVRAVLDWLRQNYTLEENPGMGQQGLFYYYHTMAKALSSAGVDELQAPDGSVNWREKLALRMLNLQQTDGSWANENNRWWEKDPALVTSYGIITMAIAQRGL